jgi:hypothetical protein
VNLRLSHRTAAITAESLPLLERARERLDGGMTRSLSAVAPQSGLQPEAVARALMDILLDGARGRSTASGLRDLSPSGAQYAMFGDALKPVLQDVLGPRATRELVAAWGDAYWAMAKGARNEVSASVRTLSTVGARSCGAAKS